MVINFELVEAATPKALNFDNPVQVKTEILSNR